MILNPSPLVSRNNHGRLNPNRNTLFLSGFGKAAASSNSNASKAPLKLKPKAQWDRFLDMKKWTPIPVAVRVVRTDGTSSDWLEVGKVKSEEDALTEMAVVIQRALLADHAKRLYPLQISAKDRVEYAISSSATPTTTLEWTLIPKDAIKEFTTGIERQCGFEGKPDPASGFYCHYVDGRLE
jgi:hypothetical protein